MAAQALQSPESLVRDALLRLERAWERSDRIFALVRTDAMLERPIGLRHPLLFYVGHLPAFARNLLVGGVLERPPLQREFDTFFDFGIDPEEGEAEERPSWPDLKPVLAYRDRVRDEIRGCATELAQRLGDSVLTDRARILHLVREHEEMHHETLLYMLQELDPRHMVRPAWWQEPSTGAAVPASERLAVEAGAVRLGADFDELEFGWDNEFPARTVEVPRFGLERAPITLAEYAEFVAADGYAEARLWDAEDLAWIRSGQRRHPGNWVRSGSDWFVRTMFEYVPLAEIAAWPAAVSLAEARGFARWRGARLPQEAELARAAFTTPEGGDDPHPWGPHEPGDPGAEQRGNFDLLFTSPCPVGSFPAGDSRRGFRELVGNGWEWTATPFLAHPGFEGYVAEYAGYSKDFFDGKHYVLFGGSWATAAGLLRRSFRNWFRFNYPYPFTKFRLAWDD